MEEEFAVRGRCRPLLPMATRATLPSPWPSGLLCWRLADEDGTVDRLVPPPTLLPILCEVLTEERVQLVKWDQVYAIVEVDMAGSLDP